MRSRWLALLALIASCEGRCQPYKTTNDALPGALCAVDPIRDSAICLRDGAVWQCVLAGSVMYKAHCFATHSYGPLRAEQ